MRTQRKYRNVPTEFNGLKFPSKMEANRYAELLLLERAGEIRDLRAQVRYELVPAVRLHGSSRMTTAIDYVADFVYEERRLRRAQEFPLYEWVRVIEDCKGVKTKVYLMKRHMMKALLGLDIFETRPR